MTPSDEATPAIVVIVEEAQLREELAALLERRFAPDYRTLAAVGSEAGPVLADLARSATPVAMVTGLVDSDVFVPWGPLERWLYLPLTTSLAAWHAHRGSATQLVIVGGPDARSYGLREIFSRATIPFEFRDARSDAGRAQLAELGQDGSRLPVLHFHPTRQTLVQPTEAEILDMLGFRSERVELESDVVIVGAGPAGLSAAVYASSEGLRTILIDGAFIGGQAGASSKIRNYLGFPHGLSGGDLTNHALEQAWLFGTEVLTPQRAVRLEADGALRVVHTADGSILRARAVVVATGVDWRRLGVPAVEELIGRGVFYGAASSEAGAQAGRRVMVVGGGNSAGQAAVHLARYASSFEMVIRRESLAATMSDYLIREIGAQPSIAVRPRTEIADAHGDERLEAVTMRDLDTGRTERHAADALFVMIGAEPRTEWLDGTLARDAQGYLLTGRAVPSADERPPLSLETSMPGVFAAGDVRHGSVKRVAPAVRLGGAAIQMVHEYLAEQHGDPEA